MLDIEVLSPDEIDKAAETFHRDGFVVVKDSLTPEQLEYAREGVYRVIAEQKAETPFEEANRGYARYSYGQQIHHPEWVMLIDLPTILPIVDKIWGSEDYVCSGAGGDYSHPGAKIQHLHSDMHDVFKDPLGLTSTFDVPAPYIVVNFMMVDFKKVNGATRFIPCTHRTRQRPPALEDEPEWMKESIISGPAAAAIIRDVRCWHGGTPNDSDEIRPMTSVGYFAPWFRNKDLGPCLPRHLYEKLSDRGKQLCRYLVSET